MTGLGGSRLESSGSDLKTIKWIELYMNVFRTEA